MHMCTAAQKCVFYKHVFAKISRRSNVKDDLKKKQQQQLQKLSSSTTLENKRLNCFYAHARAEWA